MDRIVGHRGGALGHWRSTSNRQGEAGWENEPGQRGPARCPNLPYFLDTLSKSWAPFPLIPGSSLDAPRNMSSVHCRCGRLLVSEYSSGWLHRCLWAFERTRFRALTEGWGRKKAAILMEETTGDCHVSGLDEWGRQEVALEPLLATDWAGVTGWEG